MDHSISYYHHSSYYKHTFCVVMKIIIVTDYIQLSGKLVPTACLIIVGIVNFHEGLGMNSKLVK